MAKSYSCKLVFFGGSSLLQFSIQKILYLLSVTSRSVFSPWEVFLLTQGNSIYFYLSSSRTNSNGFCKPRIIFIPPRREVSHIYNFDIASLSSSPESGGLVWILNSLPEIAQLHKSVLHLSLLQSSDPSSMLLAWL